MRQSGSAFALRDVCREGKKEGERSITAFPPLWTREASAETFAAPLACVTPNPSSLITRLQAAGYYMTGQEEVPWRFRCGSLPGMRTAVDLDFGPG